MNIQRVFALFGLVLAVSFFSSGCATSKPPMVDTWCNPQFYPKPTDTIALTDHPDPTPQDEMLARLMTNALQQGGFSVVSSDHADYLLAYVLDEAVKQQVQVNPPQYNPVVNVQSDNQIAPTTVELNPVPNRVVTYRFTSQYIRLLLYTNPKTHHGNFQLVWQGNIDTPRNASATQEKVLLKTLLDYFGKQQNGRVPLARQE